MRLGLVIWVWALMEALAGIYCTLPASPGALNLPVSCHAYGNVRSEVTDLQL